MNFTRKKYFSFLTVFLPENQKSKDGSLFICVPSTLIGGQKIDEYN